MPHSLHFASRIIENDLFKQDWRSRTKVEIYQYVVLKWTLALLIGLTTGFVGFFNNLGVENIAGFKFLLTNNLMLGQKYEYYQPEFAHLLLLIFCLFHNCLLIRAACRGVCVFKTYFYT